MPRCMVERTFQGGQHIPVHEDGAATCMNVVGENADLGVTWVHSYVSDDKWAARQAVSALVAGSPSGTGRPTIRSSRLVSGFSWQSSTAIALVLEVSQAQIRCWLTPQPSWTRLPSGVSRVAGTLRRQAASTMWAR